MFCSLLRNMYVDDDDDDDDDNNNNSSNMYLNCFL
jgi:hypothetical protein